MNYFNNLKNGFIEDTHDSYFRSASRTVKNVSAFGNVIAFNTDISKNTLLDNLSDEFKECPRKINYIWLVIYNHYLFHISSSHHFNLLL
jgi:tRNA U38,U39,U40 pseudouridine synthase TruA